MIDTTYDIIVIGAGSGGLSVGMTMNQLGFKVLMIAKTDKEIGGECLNDGCVPSKALIHLSKIFRQAREAGTFGLTITGKPDLKKVMAYLVQKQEIIRKHENASSLQKQGINIAIGEAKFTGKKEVTINNIKYNAKNIVIATGSKARKLSIPGIENINYFTNSSIFSIENLPQKFLFIGGGPIGIELAQAFNSLGSKVTVVQHGDTILDNDDAYVTSVLMQQLKKEGIQFLLNANVIGFSSSNKAIVKFKEGENQIVDFDAVFAGIGRELPLEALQLQNAGIKIKDGKIIINKYLQTTNKAVYVCGDIAGDLVFSHAAEFHARILINNFLSPFKKKLNNDYMSWVTFTNPEIATFGLNEKQLQEREIPFEKLEQEFNTDDRAITDQYQYSRMILYISRGNFLKKEKILGGTMIAPNAGEIIQELILANIAGLSITEIFNKIYPYPVASRINQQLIVKHKQKIISPKLKKLVQITYKLFG
jgi:pyruvate/2-oxoglutarate dehydrogenase complex dihydrolipoamide dehydrogenase (E3) component